MDDADRWLAEHDLENVNANSQYGQRKIKSAADEFLAQAGFDDKGRQQEVYAEEQALKRAANIVRAKQANVAVEMAEAGHAIRGMAQYVDGLKEEFQKLVPFINSAAKASMDVAVAGAIEHIETKRKRQPMVMRPRWDQRPPHLLEEAIKKAVTIEEIGQGAIAAGFDEEKLDEGTIVGAKSGRGYWRSVEFGRRFVMPQGVWRGPDGRYVKAQKGRNDAFYVSRNTSQKGRKGNIWAYDPKQQPLDYGKAKAETWIAKYLQQEASEIFFDYVHGASEAKANPFDSGTHGGGGSVGGLAET